MALPGIKKDANGLPVMTGVQERITTQNVADYTDVKRALDGVTGIDGYNARRMFAQNPEASAGLIAGLAKAGAGADNGVVKVLSQIDSYTQEQRKLEAQKESQRISTEAFNNKPWGMVWSAIKGGIRNIALVGQTGLEALNAIARHTSVAGDFFAGPIAGGINQIQKQVSGDTEVSRTNPLEELTIYQTAKELVTKGKVDLGSGFMPSEETGAGFAARQAALKAKKVAFTQGGETYYRPYSVVDPAAYVLTGGHPESAAARVIVALGELGLSFMTDPTLVTSKLKAASKLAKLQAESASGLKAAKAAEKYSILKEQETALQTAMQESIDSMLKMKEPGAPELDIAKKAKALKAQETKRKNAADKLFNEMLSTGKVSPETQAKYDKLMKETTAIKTDRLAAEAEQYNAMFKQLTKVQDEYGNLNVDVHAIEQFLTGTQGAHIIDGIAQIDNWLDIQKLAKGKFTVDEAVKLAAAKTREEVLMALAPYVANGDLVGRSLESGTTVGRALAATRNSIKETKFAQALGDKFPTILRAGEGVGIAPFVRGATAAAIKRAGLTDQIRKINERYHAFLPEQGGSLVHISNKDKLVEVINNVGTYMKLDRAVINGLMSDVALAENAQEAGMAASGKLFNAIFDKYAKEFTGDQLEEFRKATQIFETERKKIASFWAQQHATGTDINFALVNGEAIKLHSSHLDSELLNSFVFIPDGKEVKDLITTAKKFGSLRLDAETVASQLNNIWKKSVMIRPAYIARNIIEEQIRVYGVGHISFFNNPFGAMAMWLGREENSKWRALLNKFDETRNDAYGNSFKGASLEEEMSKEMLAAELVNPYMAYMSDSMTGAASEGDLNKILRTVGYTREVYGHPNWWQGYASQLRILHNSEFVQKVLRTKAGKEMETVNYFLKGEGRKTLDMFANLKKGDFKDWIKTEDGLMQYLFTGVNDKGEAVSVLARIQELTGGGDAAPFIKKLLMNGKVQIGEKTIILPNAKTIAEHAQKVSDDVVQAQKKGKKAIKADLHREFSKTLEDAFADKGNWNNIFMTVPRETSKIRAKGIKGIEQVIQERSSQFFDYAVSKEKVTTMGPEWRQSYWDAIRNISHALDKDAITKLQADAQKSLSPLRNPITGERIGAKHGAWDALKSAKGNGVLTLDEAHKYAANVANKKVAGLFYNATKRNLLFHQLRLIAPFMQAWEDTLKSWGKIALDNPIQVYKVQKMTGWTTDSGSSALYELTDAKDYYDPNQGFFFNDSTTGERKFFVPFATTGLNIIQSVLPGGSGNRITGPYGFTAQPQSFNFALGGGSVLPGFGPGVTWSLGALSAVNANPLKVLPPQIEEELFKIVFPYGTPDLKNKGLFDSPLFSSNWARLLSSAAGVESSYAAAFAPSMSYLASGGEYNLDNVDDQIRLVRDGDNMARWFTFWRGMTGAFAPIPFAMKPEALAKNKNGDTVLATSLWADFKNMEVAAGGDKTKAYGEFLDTYGPEQIFAIIRSTTGYQPTNLPTYALIRENPDMVTKYANTYGYFYPNGELSKVLYQFQQEKGSYSKLSAKQVMEKATYIRYSAALDRLRTRSVAEGWSSDQFAAVKADLDDKYAQRNKAASTITIGWNEKAINELKLAAKDNRLDNSDAMNGIRAYLVQRDKALAVAEAGGFKSLKNAATAPQREWLANEALNLIKKYPDFQKVFYGVFKKELEG